MKVKDLLRDKGNVVLTIAPEKSLSDAVALLNKHKVGALVVANDSNAILGILTERDILHCVEKKAAVLGQIPVSEEMTKDLLIAVPDDDVDYIMNIMTENHIRHVPVVLEGRLAGLISIGDVLKIRMEHCEFEARHLHDYITGKYPG
ncbi:CBS domain-containing protein [bacterium]|nr:CBS domain-containing protein [bacterium]MBU1937303.1 CBS domain-containing protein [bacterium]